MSSSPAPQADIRLESCTDGFAYGAVGAGVVCALAPLVIEFGVLIFRYNELTLWFSKFEILAYFVDDDAALSTL